MKNLLSVFLILVVFGFQSCNLVDDDGACNAGKENTILRVVVDSTMQILPQTASRIPGNVAYYEARNGTAQYYITIPQDNICSKEHLKVSMDAVLSVPAGETAKLKIYGEVYYALFFSPYSVVLFDGTAKSSTPIFRELSVGLAQAYKDKPASIEAFMKVEFPSLGTSSLDHAYFRRYIERLSIDFTYSRHQ